MSEERDRELGRLAAMPDEDIDLDEVPEVVDWDAADRGRFYRPRKKQISIRLDMDVLHWFKAQPGRYQTLINEACREFMSKRSRPDGGPPRE